MIDIESKLSVVLEETDHSQLIKSCEQLCLEVDSLKERIQTVKLRLKSMKVRLCAELAMLIRKKYPQLNVAVDKKGTKIGYKTKVVYISPDIEGKVWAFKSSDPDITKTFNNKYRKYLIITSQISDLADAIGNSFAFRYKSLREYRESSGILQIEGKNSHLVNLVEWMNANG